MKNFYLIIITLAFFIPWSTTQSQEYKHYLQTGADTSEYAQAVVHDNSGNSYFATYKEAMWQNDHDEITGIQFYKVDQQGNIIDEYFYVHSIDMWGFPHGGTVRKMIFHNNSISVIIAAFNFVSYLEEEVILNLSSSLDLQWVHAYELMENDRISIRDIAPGPGGILYMLLNHRLAIDDQNQIVTMKLRADGSTIDSAFLQTPFSDRAMRIVYSNRAVYIAGSRRINQSEGTLVVKYNDELNLQWSSTYRLSSFGYDDYVRDITVNGNGVYICGEYKSPTTLKPFAVKFDGITGTRLWERRVPYNNMRAHSIFTDPTGNPYMWVTGESNFDHFFKMNAQSGVKMTDKAMFRPSELILPDSAVVFSDFPASQQWVIKARGTNYIYSYSDFTRYKYVWDNVCQCYVINTGYGYMISKIGHNGNVLWSYHYQAFGPFNTQFDTIDVLTHIDASQDKVYFIGVYGTPNFTDHVMYGALSAYSGNREAGEMIPINEQFGIYPNPASDHTTIGLEAETDQEASIRVIDLTGQIVSEERYSLFKGMNQISMNTSALRNGIYIISIESPAMKKSSRLTVYR